MQVGAFGFRWCDGISGRFGAAAPPGRLSEIRLGKGESMPASLRKATEFESLVPQTDSCTTTKLGALAIYFLTWKAVQLLRTGPIERVV